MMWNVAVEWLVCTPWFKLTSVSSDNLTQPQRVGVWLGYLRTVRPCHLPHVLRQAHIVLTLVLLEFQIGREKVHSFFSCWITKKTVTSWALDFQRQRFKAGLAGFCYLTCFRWAWGKRTILIWPKQNKNWKGKHISFLKPKRHNSGVI